MSTSSNNDARFFENKRCKCGEKAGVYISELEKNPGKLYFKCANKACDYFAWGVAPTGNGSNIQKSGYDYGVAEVVNILERLEANQRERLKAIKFMMLTTIVMVGFTMLVVLLK
ncbi:hypothetical protein ACSBR1_017533 [Camellia fascicularis]